MLYLPPIYPITDMNCPLELSEQIGKLGEAGFPLTQFRGKGLNVSEQWKQLKIALKHSNENGGWPMICVNDRADLAVLAAEEGITPWGLHLGQSDLPASEAKRLPGLEGLHLGTSTHTEDEWSQVDQACDHVGVGPFKATLSKSDHAIPIGIDGLKKACQILRSRGIAPIAIGGIELTEVGTCFQAGTECIAMISAISAADDPAELLWEAQRMRWMTYPLFRKGQGIVLIGGSGAGKTELAIKLSERLGMPVKDLDAVIVAKVGKSIARIFQEDGEKAFRDLEILSMQNLVEDSCVIAIGGGAWESSRIREMAKKAGFSILWLAEKPSTAWSRVQNDPGRPLALSREYFMKLWRQRSITWQKERQIFPLGRTTDELAEMLVRYSG